MGINDKNETNFKGNEKDDKNKRSNGFNSINNIIIFNKVKK